MWDNYWARLSNVTDGQILKHRKQRLYLGIEPDAVVTYYCAYNNDKTRRYLLNQVTNKHVSPVTNESEATQSETGKPEVAMTPFCAYNNDKLSSVLMNEATNQNINPVQDQSDDTQPEIGAQFSMTAQDIINEDNRMSFRYFLENKYLEISEGPVLVD